MTSHVPKVWRVGAFVAGAVALAILATAQGSFQTSQPAKFEIGPHPRDFVQIRQGTPYTVPSGKIFVLTALGGNEYSADCCPFPDMYKLAVDDDVQVYAHPYYAFETPSIRPVPPGFTVHAGSTIELSGGSSFFDDTRAWGYLADPLPPAFEGKVVRVPYAPHPSDMVRFGQGSFYIVPPGKRFVLTGFGADDTSGTVRLRVNAVQELTSSARTYSEVGNPNKATDEPSIRPVPLGFSLPAGSIVEITSDVGNGGVACGYLLDA